VLSNEVWATFIFTVHGTVQVIAELHINLAMKLAEVLKQIWLLADSWNDEEKHAIAALARPVDGLFDSLDRLYVCTPTAGSSRLLHLHSMRHGCGLGLGASVSRLPQPLNASVLASPRISWQTPQSRLSRVGQHLGLGLGLRLEVSCTSLARECGSLQ